MASPTKMARDLVRQVLSAENGGFNSRVGSILTASGIEPFAVDFSPGSLSFFQGYINPDGEDVSSSQISPAPCAICLYAINVVNAKTTNAKYFAGAVELRVDVYVQMRAREATSSGVEADDTDTAMDAVEEAIFYSLRDGFPEGIVTYNQDFECERTPLFLLGDGYAQRTSIKIGCIVRIN